MGKTLDDMLTQNVNDDDPPRSELFSAINERDFMNLHEILIHQDQAKYIYFQLCLLFVCLFL